MQKVDDVPAVEFAGDELGGEETHVGEEEGGGPRDERSSVDRMDGAEALEDTEAASAGPGVGVPLDELAVLSAVGGARADEGLGHVRTSIVITYLRMLLSRD